MLLFNCANVFPYFLPFRRAGTRLLFVKWLLSKAKGRITGGSENVCIYVGNRRVTSALVLSTEQLFGTGTAQYIVS